MNDGNNMDRIIEGIIRPRTENRTWKNRATVRDTDKGGERIKIGRGPGRDLEY
jgi:hypothetical protein